MTTHDKDTVDNQTVEDWLQTRKEEGKNIDPNMAEVAWSYKYVGDPYGVGLKLSEEYQCVGRAYFARSPGSDIWVWFGDLPDRAADGLWRKHREQLAFPAGLFLG